jgi:asparagine synthase (glutamine-hydrolysing)
VGAPESTLPFEEAAEELTRLLSVAAHERLDGAAPSSVWMSGGWDSTAAFAAAYAAAKSAGLPSPAPVSISYPEGDPGREDELIQQVAEHSGVGVRWIDIANVPLLENEPERAAHRDEPYAHLYVHWNTALAEGSRSVGARVALDGNGGDQLFQNSDVFLADLLRQGRWRTLAREWKARPRGGPREFFSSVVQPTLPAWALRMVAALRRGRRLRHYLERKLPEWIEPLFARRERLEERDFDYLLPDLPVSLTQREMAWYFSNIFVSRAFSLLGGFSLSRGVELRSPLVDRRVVEFALSRPWWERSSGKETKRLLRRSMREMLPASVLAPRTHRTGITSGYSHRWMTEVFPALLRETLERPMLLEELGVVNAAALRRCSDDYRWAGDAYTRVNMYYTLQAELWLRAKDRRHGAARDFPTAPLSSSLAATA